MAQVVVIEAQTRACRLPEAFDGTWIPFVHVAERLNSEWRVLSRVAAAEFWGSPQFARLALDTLEQELIGHEGGSEMMLSLPARNKDGFDIDVQVYSEKVHASFGGLEQDFETIESAMTWVRRAHSSSYRLRLTLVGNFPREWHLEPISNNETL